METSKVSRKIRLLLMSQFFFPDRTGTGKILGELFTGLADHVFSTVVVSSRQEYGVKTNALLPVEEHYGKVSVKRSGRHYFSKNSTCGRLMNYVLAFVNTAFTVIRESLAKDRDILICVSNPPIMPLLLVWLKRRQQKTVYILHDLYPDIAIAMGVVGTKHIFSRLMFACNKYVFARLDKIVVLGEDMKKYLKFRYEVPEDKLAVIPNWASADYRECVSTKKIDGKFEVLYSGNMGRFHQLDIAVSALAGKQNVVLHFVGEGQAKAELMAQVGKEDNVRFDSFLDDIEYRKTLQNADVLFVSLEHNLSGLAVPSKFYTYLSAGKPIICVADKSTEMAELITKHECGFVVSHGNVARFRQCVDKLECDKELRLRMGDNSHKLYEQFFRKDQVIAAYEHLFAELGA